MKYPNHESKEDLQVDSCVERKRSATGNGAAIVESKGWGKDLIAIGGLRRHGPENLIQTPIV